MMKRKTHPLSRKKGAIGVALVTLCAALVHSEALAQDPSTWLPPARDTSQIVLDYEETAGGFGVAWELDYYVNGAYDCGLSGNYSFLVMNPADDPTATASVPWVTAPAPRPSATARSPCVFVAAAYPIASASTPWVLDPDEYPMAIAPALWFVVAV